MNIDTVDLILKRKYVSILMLFLIKNDYRIIFFEETSYSDNSYKKKVWKLGSLKQVHVSRKVLLGSFHVLLTMSIDMV